MRLEARIMYCKNCGKSIDDDAKFCKFCGTNQENINPEKNSTKPLADIEKSVFVDSQVSVSQTIKNVPVPEWTPTSVENFSYQNQMIPVYEKLASFNDKQFCPECGNYDCLAKNDDSIIKITMSENSWIAHRMILFKCVVCGKKLIEPNHQQKVENLGELGSKIPIKIIGQSNLMERYSSYVHLDGNNLCPDCKNIFLKDTGKFSIGPITDTDERYFFSDDNLRDFARDISVFKKYEMLFCPNCKKTFLGTDTKIKLTKGEGEKYLDLDDKQIGLISMQYGELPPYCEKCESINSFEHAIEVYSKYGSKNFYNFFKCKKCSNMIRVDNDEKIPPKEKMTCESVHLISPCDICHQNPWHCSKGTTFFCANCKCYGCLDHAEKKGFFGSSYACPKCGFPIKK